MRSRFPLHICDSLEEHSRHCYKTLPYVHAMAASTAYSTGTSVLHLCVSLYHLQDICKWKNAVPSSREHNTLQVLSWPNAPDLVRLILSGCGSGDDDDDDVTQWE